MAHDDVRAWREGALGRIRLERPRSLNALDRGMVADLAAAYARWWQEPGVTAIALDGAGERGLCAGADVRAVRAGALDGSADPVEFWREEYAVIASLLRPPRPTVAFMDGIVMGAGVGLSAYSQLRLVTPRTRLAMPEVGIGLFPDVGTLYALARAPGAIGVHLALTGATCTGADAIAAGLADLQVDPQAWAPLCAELAGGADVAHVRERLEERGEASVPHAPLLDATWIGECYQGDDPAEILGWLRSHPHPQAREAADLLASRSPLSVAVTLAALRRAEEAPDVAAVIETDLRIAAALMAHPDFNEGVRAQLVDKDRTPTWQHASLAEIDPELVARIVG